MKKLLLWRRLSQTFFLFFFILVPVLNLYGFHEMYGNLLAFNFFGLHLVDPLSALQVCLGIFSDSNTLVSAIIPSEMLWGAFFVLLIASVFGSVFCSWLCPYGFFSELVWKMREKKRSFPRSAEGKTNNSSFGMKVKFFLFAIGILFVFFLHQGPILNQLSLPAWYTRLWQHVFLYGQILIYPVVAILFVLILEFILHKRFWCSYICPQSILISFFGAILPIRLAVKFNQKSCTCAAKERACIKACSFLLDSRKLVGADRVSCTNCGDCVQACQHACKLENKALQYSFIKKKEK